MPAPLGPTQQENILKDLYAKAVYPVTNKAMLGFEQRTLKPATALQILTVEIPAAEKVLVENSYIFTNATIHAEYASILKDAPSPLSWVGNRSIGSAKAALQSIVTGGAVYQNAITSQTITPLVPITQQAVASCNDCSGSAGSGSTGGALPGMLDASGQTVPSGMTLNTGNGESVAATPQPIGENTSNLFGKASAWLTTGNNWLWLVLVLVAYIALRKEGK